MSYDYHKTKEVMNSRVSHWTKADKAEHLGISRPTLDKYIKLYKRDRGLIDSESEYLLKYIERLEGKLVEYGENQYRLASKRSNYIRKHR